MVIQCSEINQVINELLIAFQDCNKIKNSDLRKLVELVSAVNTCQSGGPHYDTMIVDSFEAPQIVTYPVNTFHSISISVLSGVIDYSGFVLSAGTVKNIEFTTLNQTEITFEVKPGSIVMVEYLIETV